VFDFKLGKRNMKFKWGVRRTPPEVWANLGPLAQQKRQSPTAAEQRLWLRLRNRQIVQAKFRRQHTIERFIVDFYCAEHLLSRKMLYGRNF
jgi:hypothetical protein